MIREAFALRVDADNIPVIKKVDITEPDGVSWREAKKQLRTVYVNRIKALRQLTQKDYFIHA